MYHANVNVTLIVANVTQIKSGIMIKVTVGSKIYKNIMCEKRLYLESWFI